jgi:hypothetical protein
MLRVEGLALMAFGLSTFCGSTSVELVALKGHSKVKNNDDSRPHGAKRAVLITAGQPSRLPCKKPGKKLG